MGERITSPEDWAKHQQGRVDCTVCCCQNPTPCKECGAGLVHCEVVDEWWTDDDSGWIHEYQCDRCGDTTGGW